MKFSFAAQSIMRISDLRFFVQLEDSEEMRTTWVECHIDQRGDSTPDSEEITLSSVLVQNSGKSLSVTYNKTELEQMIEDGEIHVKNDIRYAEKYIKNITWREYITPETYLVHNADIITF